MGLFSSEERNAAMLVSPNSHFANATVVDLFASIWFSVFISPKLKKSLEGYAVRFLKPSVPIAIGNSIPFSPFLEELISIAEIEAGFELTSVAANPGFIPFSKTELPESNSELELEQDSCDPEFPESGEQERISPNESSYNGESPLTNKRSEPLFSKSGGLVWAQTVSKEPKCI
nr:hypothetical protein Iba_chr03fCG3370 [Ipomoea batatas]